MTAENNLPKNTKSISDTALAAYLYLEGFTIVDIDYSVERANYLFKNDNPKLEEYIHLFETGKALADPADLIRINRRLSNIVRNRLPWMGSLGNG